MGKAREAGEATRTAYRNEAYYGEKFIIGETEYNTIDEYLAVLNENVQNSTGDIVLTFETSSDQDGVGLYVYANPYMLWAQKKLESLPSDEPARSAELNQLFIEGTNYWAIEDGDVEPGTVFTSLQDVWDYWDWSDCPYTSVEEYYENEMFEFFNSCETMLISWEDVNFAEYIAENNTAVTIRCGTQQNTIMPPDSAYFRIEDGGEYKITAEALDGSKGEITVNVIKLPASALIELGDTEELIQETNGELIWYSTDSSIASVENGLVTGRAIGTGYITVTDNSGTVISNSCKVKVVEEIAEYSASEISSNTYNTFYGMTVNYPVSIMTAMNSKWKIFYSDGTNIFIIPDANVLNTSLPLIDYSTNPATINAGLTAGTDSWTAGWDTIPAAQQVSNLGTSFKFSAWSDYSSYDHQKVVSTMLNTNNWEKFVDSRYADYAIGGPTVEMFCASYNSKGSGTNQDNVYRPYTWNTVDMSREAGEGYTWGNGPYGNTQYVSNGTYADGTGGYDRLYFTFPNNNSLRYAYWIASPAGFFNHGEYGPGDVACVTGDYGLYCVSFEEKIGFRPLVRLKSGISLRTSASDGYDFDLVTQ